LIAIYELPAELATRLQVQLSLNQEQAIASWAEDVLHHRVQGPEIGVADSRLLYHVNHRNFQIAAAEFSKWCLVHGRPNPAMLKKRREEQALFRST
jgi:GH24 family phage-related lysozyme (muramidase)